jgi:hypothetical protein
MIAVVNYVELVKQLLIKDYALEFFY